MPRYIDGTDSREPTPISLPGGRESKNTFKAQNIQYKIPSKRIDVFDFAKDSNNPVFEAFRCEDYSGPPGKRKLFEVSTSPPPLPARAGRRNRARAVAPDECEDGQTASETEKPPPLFRMSAYVHPESADQPHFVLPPDMNTQRCSQQNKKTQPPVPEGRSSPLMEEEETEANFDPATRPPSPQLAPATRLSQRQLCSGSSGNGSLSKSSGRNIPKRKLGLSELEREKVKEEFRREMQLVRKQLAALRISQYTQLERGRSRVIQDKRFG